MVNYIIETEPPQICKVDVANIRKIQVLVKLVCDKVPFELNANKIASAFEIRRDTVVEYIEYLGDAKIFPRFQWLPDSYIFADDWDIPDGAKLPL